MKQRRRREKGKEVMAKERQTKKRVNEDDAAKFIKTQKRSEYFVVKQLKKQPAPNLHYVVVIVIQGTL